jgi:hypothetical protein
MNPRITGYQQVNVGLAEAVRRATAGRQRREHDEEGK